MKSAFFVLLLLLFCSKGYSQARIGFTDKEIRKEFPKGKFKSGIDKDGDKYLSVELSTMTVIYYFNSDDRCSLTAAIPDDQGSLNAMVEDYNKKYVIVSDKEWKMYNDNGIMTIELVFPEKGSAYFLMK